MTPGSYDLVLCHGLLEVVDSPAETLAAVAGALRPGGGASVLAAGRAAAVLARALGGRLADAIRLRHRPGRAVGADRPDAAPVRRDRARRRWSPRPGCGVEAVHGVGVVADLVPGAVLEGQPGATEALRELEAAVAGRPPYRDVAAQLHLLARR